MIEKPQPKQRFHALDGTRGLAAICVFLYHAKNNTILTENFFVRESPFFVEFFFVLSGFVISYNYIDRIYNYESFKAFIKNRFIRLYPLLFYTVSLFFLMLLIGKRLNIVNNIEFRSWYQIYKAYLDSLFMMNSTPILGSTLGVNYPSWSISAEIISYFCFAIVLLFSFNKRNIVFIILGPLCLILFNLLGHEKGSEGYLHAIYCFTLGYFTYVVWERVSLKFKTIHEILSFLVLIIAFYYMYNYEDYTNYLRQFSPLLFACIIFIFINSDGFLNKLLNTNFSKFIGNISYSFYLNHALVLFAVEKFMFNLLKCDNQSLFVNVIYLSIALSFTMVYSYYTNKYIEVGIGQKLMAILNKERKVLNKRKETDTNLNN